MSERTKIAWCDSTFNPWIGCEPVSAGCEQCYATRTWARMGLKPGERRRTSAGYWRQPEMWNKRLTCDCGTVQVGVNETWSPCPVCKSKYRKRRVFCGSLCDWLDAKVPVEWLADLLDLIIRTPNLNWLLLTKRPEIWSQAMKKVLDDPDATETPGPCPHWSMVHNWLGKEPPPNVWLGVTAENQEQWDRRVPLLLRIPAAKRFVSVEPMLGKIDFAYSTFNGADSFGSMEGIHWVILGGESGQKARPCNVEWIRNGLKQCRESSVPVFVKQLGSNPCGHWVSGAELPLPDAGWKLRIQTQKGGDPAEWPEDLRVQEWPV